MVNYRYIPDRGDIVYIDVNPSLGHEQKGRRPCLVLTEKKYNIKTELVIAIPITSRPLRYGTELPLEGQKIVGSLMVQQIKTLDWKLREIEFIEKIKKETLKKCQNLIISILS
jgi:mRNA interferase MazF